MTTSSCIPVATCGDPHHAPRPRCRPLLQHRYIHCRLCVSWMSSTVLSSVVLVFFLFIAFSCQPPVEVHLQFWMCNPSHAAFETQIICSDPVKLVLGEKYHLFQEESHTAPEMRKSGPFFVIRLSFTSRTKNSVCLLFDSSKGFLQVRVAWDFSLTDFPPASRVFLVFSPASPPPTLPFSLLFNIIHNTTWALWFPRPAWKKK